MLTPMVPRSGRRLPATSPLRARRILSDSASRSRICASATTSMYGPDIILAPPFLMLRCSAARDLVVPALTWIIDRNTNAGHRHPDSRQGRTGQRPPLVLRTGRNCAPGERWRHRAPCVTRTAPGSQPTRVTGRGVRSGAFDPGAKVPTAPRASIGGKRRGPVEPGWGEDRGCLRLRDEESWGIKDVQMRAGGLSHVLCVSGRPSHSSYRSGPYRGDTCVLALVAFLCNVVVAYVRRRLRAGEVDRTPGRHDGVKMTRDRRRGRLTTRQCTPYTSHGHRHWIRRPCRMSRVSMLTQRGGIAQLGERYNRTVEVGGSNPPASTHVASLECRSVAAATTYDSVTPQP